MADEVKTKVAKETYQTLLKAIELNGWKCEQNDEKLAIHFGVNGDDLHMDFIIVVDVERQLVRLISRLPFNFNRNKLMEGAIATCVANYSIADGSFDYDIFDGSIYFRMTTSYRSSVISHEALMYLVNCAAYTVDKFNDKLLMVNSGAMSLDDFIAENS